MCVCVFVCMYIYIYKYICNFVCACIYICVYLYMYIKYIYICQAVLNKSCRQHPAKQQLYGHLRISETIQIR